MGAKSTVYVSKAEALTFIIENLAKADDDALADMMEALNDSLPSGGTYGKICNFVIDEGE
jgi:hypothetical protein